MNYIVAVSGGVDSVVLLHKLIQIGTHTLTVAHFDHGIRPASDADARFVKALTKLYDLPYESRREELGPKASEATARERRYLYLRHMANKHQATIATAHHADDLIETIAINLIRGTGWRGLAVFDSPTIERPLLPLTKRDIYDYALAHQLEWVEDETNATDVYLRNRVRSRIHQSVSLETRNRLMELWQAQRQLKHEIMDEEKSIIETDKPYSRYVFTHIDPVVASELLRFITKQGITRPQAERALHTIKTARSGTVSQIGAGLQLTFTAGNFTVQTP